MKPIFTSIFLIVSLLVSNSWSQLNGPESVAYDAATDSYYIGNVNNGTIYQMDSNGNYKLFTTYTGGMGGLIVVEDILYGTAGMTGLVGFDLTTAEVVMEKRPLGMIGLNDCTTDNAGNLYTTDILAHRIYKVQLNDLSSTTIAAGIPSPNGILFDEINNRLLVCCYITDAPIYAIDLSDYSKYVVISTTLDNLDGLTEDNDGNIYVSAWGNHSIYRFDHEFANPLELVSSGHSGPADIFFNKHENILAVPNYNINTVDFLSFNDVDEDGLLDYLDNCPDNYNPNQDDNDEDGNGNECDLCPGSDDNLDEDNDTVPDNCDDCPGYDDLSDADADGLPDGCDNCTNYPNIGQLDADEDGVGDACDNCPEHFNPEQEDSNGNDVGDLCDYICGDGDGNSSIDILDVVFIINYKYKDGTAPDPLESVDVNGDTKVTILDVVYIINFRYKEGPDPACVVWE